MKLLVVFSSTYGDVYRMAQAIAEGSRAVDGARFQGRHVASIAKKLCA